MDSLPSTPPTSPIVRCGPGFGMGPKVCSPRVFTVRSLPPTSGPCTLLHGLSGSPSTMCWRRVLWRPQPTPPPTARCHAFTPPCPGPPLTPAALPPRPACPGTGAPPTPPRPHALSGGPLSPSRPHALAHPSRPQRPRLGQHALELAALDQRHQARRALGGVGWGGWVGGGQCACWIGLDRIGDWIVDWIG